MRTGRINPLVHPVTEPEILTKSMKFGITNAVPVTKHIIIVLLTTLLTFLTHLDPLLYHSRSSNISKATRIYTGYEIMQLTQTQPTINVVNPFTLNEMVRISLVWPW